MNDIKNLTTDNFYLCEHGVPTVALGDGRTVICAIETADGFRGVSFVPGEGEVGKDQTEIVGGKVDYEIGAFLRILTTNPASIQVLIDKLERAKDGLLNKGNNA